MTSWEEYWASCQRLHNEAVIRGWGIYKEELDEKRIPLVVYTLQK